MKITIAAIGRMKRGPEDEMFRTYIKRLEQTGRQAGLSGVMVREFDESRLKRDNERKSAEAVNLAKAVTDNGVLIALDERGKTMTSVEFARKIGGFCDQGVRETVFLIGGPDGLDPDLVKKADIKLSLGAMTWPHMMARVLLAEQLYRGFAILTGHPYHRA